MTLSHEATVELQLAKSLLKSPSLAVKLTSLVGAPIEKSLNFLPARWKGGVNSATTIALRNALRFAVSTMGQGRKLSPSNALHTGLVAASGGLGGAFGLPALVAELPISTIIMLRSIADIARSEGESIKTLEARLACLEVFALGGRSKVDDGADTGYFAVRAALSRSISEAARHITEKGLADKGAPAIVRLITQIAARFNVVVTQKAAAQAVPIIGAVSGIAINSLFIRHFQKMARGHFIIRRLERSFGGPAVAEAYNVLDVY